MSLEQLGVALAYAFKSPGLMQQALTHRSYSADNNERFEFLGDSVLNFVIAETLFERFPRLSEGALSRLRANLVRQETLAKVAIGISLGSCIRLGDGELKSGGAQRASILADALEALIGAIHRDGGYAAARDTTLRLFSEVLAGINPDQSSKDPKTTLQEFLQGRKLDLPVYELLTTRGEAHAQEFEVECRIPVLKISCSGRGASRRAAEQAAASVALEKIEA
jgi:ribonuclease-3